jgi:hypothetical protein
MSEPSPLDLAVKLLIDSGAQVQSWTMRFIGAHIALFAMVGSLMAWGDPAEHHLQIFNVVLLAICLFGAFCSLVLGSFVFRQLRWHKKIVDRMQALQDQQKPVLAEDNTLSGGVYLAALTFLVTAAVSLVWIALLLLIWYSGPVLESS